MKNIGRKGHFQAPIEQTTELVQFAGETPKPKKKAYKRTELDENMYLQPEETRAFFDVIESRRDRAIFRVLYHHGLRAHEIAGRADPMRGPASYLAIIGMMRDASSPMFNGRWKNDYRRTLLYRPQPARLKSYRSLFRYSS
jgi:hypothetical protein